MKSKWFRPMEFNFASTPTITPGGSGDSGSGGGAGAGSTGSQPTGGGNTSGGASSAPPVTPPVSDPWNAPNTPAHLREGYNTLKKELDDLKKQYDPYKSLNVKPEDIGRFQQGYQQTYGEIKGLADAIGINENEVAEAIQKHGLVPVLRQLELEYQQAAAAAEGDPNALNERDLEERINNVAERVLSPIQQRENQRVTKEANIAVENTIIQLASDGFKSAGLDWAQAPPDLKNFIMTGVTEVLKYDEAALLAIKTEGKMAPVQKAFQTFTAMWDAAYLARRGMESKLPPVRTGAPKAQPAPQGKGPSLEEMINNPDTVREAQGKPGYAT